MTEPITLHKISSLYTVGLVEGLKQQVHVSGSGADAIFKDGESLGWQLCLTPKLTLLMEDKPPFEAGDRVKLSLEKLP